MIRPGSLPYYPITLLPHYPITPLPHYPITLLPHYPITLLPHYPITPLASDEAVAEYDYAGESALRIGGGSVGRNE